MQHSEQTKQEHQHQPNVKYQHNGKEDLSETDTQASNNVPIQPDKVKLEIQEKQLKKKEYVKQWKQQANAAKQTISKYHLHQQQNTKTTQNTQNTQNHLKTITKSNIAQLFKIHFYHDLATYQYKPQQGQDPYFSQVYKQVYHMVKMQLIYPTPETHVNKTKTFIIRKILDSFVYQFNGVQSKEAFNVQRKRLTNKDRMYYAHAGLPVPSCRIYTQYLLQVFQNSNFKAYFKAFIKTGRLGAALKTMNIGLIQLFQLQINRIQKVDASVEVRIDLLKAKQRRPIVMGNICQYENEARVLLLQFCQ